MADSTDAEPETNEEEQAAESARGDGGGITGKVKQAADAATKIPSAATKIPSAVKDAAAPVTESAASTVKKAAIRRRLRSKKVVIPAALTTATAAAVVVARKVSDGGPGAETSEDEGGVKGLLTRALSSVTRLADGGGGETRDDPSTESQESERGPGAGEDSEQEAPARKSRRELDEGLRAREERRARRRESQAA